jgi:hypothetical protein
VDAGEFERLGGKCCGDEEERDGGDAGVFHGPAVLFCRGAS